MERYKIGDFYPSKEAFENSYMSREAGIVVNVSADGKLGYYIPREVNTDYYFTRLLVQFSVTDKEGKEKST